MIRIHRDNSIPQPSTQIGPMAWFVAALLTVALICLLHDRSYATAKGLALAEAGRGLEFKAVNESGLAVAAPSRLIGFALLVSVGVICAATLPGKPRLSADSLLLLIGLALAWAILSWTWSDNRGTTARELVRLTIYVVVAAALACRFDLRRLCIVLGIAISGSVLASVGYEVATGGFRPWQADYRLTGSLHSNMVGIQAAVVAIIAYAFAVRGNDRKALWYSIFAAAVTIVVLSKTRTSLGTVVAAVVVIHLVGRPWREPLLYASSAASLAAIAILAASVLQLPLEKKVHKILTLGREGAEASSLTGRVPLWGFIWHETAGRRIQGAGYGAFWQRERTEEGYDALRWYPRHSHNGYIEILANLGLVGLLLLLAIGILAARRAAGLAARFGRPEHYAAVAILCAAFVNGLTETAFVMPRDIGLLACAMIFGVVLQKNLRSDGRAVRAPRASLRSAAPFVPRPDRRWSRY